MLSSTCGNLNRAELKYPTNVKLCSSVLMRAFNLADSQFHGEHVARPASYEVPVYQNVLLQELPQHC